MTLRYTPSEIVGKLIADGRAGALAGHLSWPRVRLGDVAHIVNGAPFQSQYFNSDGIGIPLIRIRDVGTDRSSTWYSGEWEKWQVVNRGDLLIGMDGAFKSARWLGDMALLNQRVCRVDLVDPRFDQRFLGHALQPYLDAIWAATSSTTVKHLSSKSVADIPLPCPDIAEQRRIVAVLEDHLSRLDAADVYLSAISDRSVTVGLSSTRRLLASAHGRHVALGELLDASIGGIWGRPIGQGDVDVTVIRVTELRPGGRIDESTAACRSISSSEFASRSLRSGDLLLEKSGGGPNSPVGRVGLIETLSRPSVCSNFMQLMRVDQARVVPAFLHLYLNHVHACGGTSGMQKASTNIRNIKASDYMRLPVPVPAVEEQRRIVAEAAVLNTDAERLRREMAAAGRHSRVLHQALMVAAFTGKLAGRSSNEKVVDRLVEAAS